MSTQVHVMVPLDLIDPNPYQPRQKDDDQVVLELADDIERNGLMQIPTARNSPGGRYQLAFGHTRLAAYRYLVAAGKKDFAEFPLFIRELDDLQMFERAVAENIKRRDLSPIEVARAMQRYRDFGKTSAEIGQFFGVNEATVRGTIRLLELPEKAQEMVADGSLTQGNARKLLSLGRIVNEDKVLAVAEKLPLASDPDGLIGNALRDHLDNVVELGSQRYDSKQVTAGDGLWELNWKVPEDDIHISKLWPAEKDLLASWKGADEIDGMKIKSIFYEIYTSLTSIIPGFRKTYEDLYETHPEWSPAIDLYRHLMQPPVCTSCPLLVRTPAGYYFCGMKACHDRKRNAWISQELNRLSQELGIKIYDSRVDGKATEDMSGWNTNDEKLFTERDNSLRLKAAPRSWNNDLTKNQTVKVVIVGEEVKKAKKAAKRAENSYKSRQDDWMIRQKRVDANNKKLKVFIWEHVTDLLEPLFAGITSLDVLGWMSYAVSMWNVPEEEPDEKAPKVRRVAFYRKFLALAFILDDLVDDEDETEGDIIAEIAGKICNKAKTAGIAFPKGWAESWVTNEGWAEEKLEEVVV